MSLTNTRISKIRKFEAKLFIPIGISNRSYKFIQLPNGLLTLLISDPTDDVSSVALAVALGANNDPPDIPGLAHFCEHTILLGSKKYPKVNHLQKLITSTNGGAINAYTSGETTCFYYQMNCPNNDYEVLDQSLDVFADIFQNPLFPPIYLKKEVYAINNEHLENKHKLSKVFLHALRLLSSPDCTFNRFATGNLDTLSSQHLGDKNNLNEAVVNYFKKHYTPDKFTLVIKGPQSSNILQKLAIKHFDFGNFSGLQKDLLPSQLEEFHILQDSYEYNTPPFRKQELNRCIFIKYNEKVVKSLKNTIRLAFPITHDHKDAMASRKVFLFSEAIVSIFGSEHDSSLFHLLKQKSLIGLLCCYVSEIHQGCHCLLIEMKLEKSGVSMLDYIIAVIFSAVQSSFKTSNSLLSKNRAILARYLSENFAIKQTNYLYSDFNESAMDQASDYAFHMQQNISALGSEWLLKGSPSWSSLPGFQGFYGESEYCNKWWESVASEMQQFVLENFNMNNMNLLIYGDDQIISQNSLLFKTDDYYIFNKDQKFKQDQGYGIYKDLNFGFSYKYYRVNVNELNRIISVQDRIVQDTYSLLLFPNNMFITEIGKKYQMMSQMFTKCYERSLNILLGFDNNKATLLDTLPKLVSKGSLHQLWYKVENSNKYQGKCLISWDMVSIQMQTTAAAIVSLEILCEIFNLRLALKLYLSEVLGYSWNLITSSKNDIRIGVVVGGFNDGIDTLINTILQDFKSLSTDFTEVVSDKDYFQARLKIKSFYNDLATQNSLQLATAGSVVILEECSFGIKERLAELEENTFEDIAALVTEFFDNQLFTNIFLQGDVDINMATKVSYSLNNVSKHVELLKSQNRITKKPQHNVPTTHFIKPGSNLYYEVNSEDLTNSIVFFIQTGPKDSVLDRTMTKLIGFLISLEAISELRTKRQLGYVVLAGMRIYSATIGIHFSIVSGNHKPSFLEQEIKDFLGELEAKWETYTEDKFNEMIKYAFLKTFIREETNFRQKSNNNLFYENLNETNIKQFVNFSHGAKNDDTKTLENMSLLSMVKTGGCLSNLNTELAKKHFILWDEIISGTCRFQTLRSDYSKSSSLNNNYDIDLMIVKNLTKEQFMNYWYQKVSMYSKSISKLSIWVNKDKSQHRSKDQITELIISQIEALLMMNNVSISRDKLYEIVRQSNNNQAKIIKALFKHFIKNGQKARVISIILKNVFQKLGMILKSNASIPNIKSPSSSFKNQSLRSMAHDVGVELEEIDNLDAFHTEHPAIH